MRASDRPRAGRARPIAFVSAVLAGLLLAGCSTTGTAPPASGGTRPSAIATSRSTTQSGSRIESGIPFATVDGVVLRLNACLPKSGGSHPGLVIVPGGGFTERTRDLLSPECMEGADRGYATFVVDYRLVGEGSGGSSIYPAQVQDVERAIRWVRAAAQAQRFGLDRTDMVLLGESAGAIVASEIAVGTPGATLPRSTFRGVALFSGVYDFGRSDLSDYLVGVAKGYFGCAPSSACAPTRTASAARHVKSDDPPMLLVNSATELVGVVQVQEFDARLTAAKVQHELLIAPGAYHALDIARRIPSVNTALWAFVKERTGS